MPMAEGDGLRSSLWVSCQLVSESLSDAQGASS